MLRIALCCLPMPTPLRMEPVFMLVATTSNDCISTVYECTLTIWSTALAILAHQSAMEVTKKRDDVLFNPKRHRHYDRCR